MNRLKLLLLPLIVGLLGFTACHDDHRLTDFDMELVSDSLATFNAQKAYYALSPMDGGTFVVGVSRSKAEGALTVPLKYDYSSKGDVQFVRNYFAELPEEVTFEAGSFTTEIELSYAGTIEYGDGAEFTIQLDLGDAIVSKNAELGHFNEIEITAEVPALYEALGTLTHVSEFYGGEVFTGTAEVAEAAKLYRLNVEYKGIPAYQLILTVVNGKVTKSNTALMNKDIDNYEGHAIALTPRGGTMAINDDGDMEFVLNVLYWVPDLGGGFGVTEEKFVVDLGD